MPLNPVSLPFREQSEFFRRKLNMPTQAWTDIYREQHDYAFVVAGANRDDIVGSFRESLERVVNGGITLEEFRKDFDKIVKQYGWSYNGGRNWRTRIIYETNLNSSYMAGRYQQLLAVRETRPYWQYIHNDAVEFPRPHHLAWDGLILRWDDPWWRTHFPPGGWGCQCRVRALSESDLRAMGRTVDAAPPDNFMDREIGKRSPGGPFSVRVPEGIDPGFDYIPGRSRLEGNMPPMSSPAPLTPAPRPQRQTALPTPRPAPAPLPENLSPQQYANDFLREFDAVDEPVIFKDLAGESHVIGQSLFENGSGDMALGNLGPAARWMALALREPDEVWARLEVYPNGKSAVIRNYLLTITPEGETTPVQVVVEWSKYGWSAMTSRTNPELDLQDLRMGERLYRRGD